LIPAIDDRRPTTYRFAGSVPGLGGRLLSGVGLRRVGMDYGATHIEDVPVTDLSKVEAIPPDHDIRALGDALGTEETTVNLWYFEPGEEIGYHAHSEQEELYYVLEGEFSLKLGRSGEAEIVEVGPGNPLRRRSGGRPWPSLHRRGRRGRPRDRRAARRGPGARSPRSRRLRGTRSDE
jgi:mannose-6-phosphate isomerase-like protein (cupin superfamily)